MRKIVAIPLIILILFTGITVNLAAHYCGGSFIASRISFSGKLATCGMDHTGPEKPGISEADHTCQDFTSSYTFSGNYVPASVNYVNQYLVIQPAGSPPDIILNSTIQVAELIDAGRPPGIYNPGDVDLEVICIFRI